MDSRGIWLIQDHLQFTPGDFRSCKRPLYSRRAWDNNFNRWHAHSRLRSCERNSRFLPWKKFWIKCPFHWLRYPSHFKYACQSVVRCPSQKPSCFPKHSTFKSQPCLSPSLERDQMDYLLVTPSQSCSLFWLGDQKGLSSPNGSTPSEPVSKSVETRNSSFKIKVLALCQRIHNLGKWVQSTEECYLNISLPQRNHFIPNEEGSSSFLPLLEGAAVLLIVLSLSACVCLFNLLTKPYSL